MAKRRQPLTIKRRRALRREKPRRGTLPLLLGLCALLALLVFFAPASSQQPAANLSGAEVSPEAAATGDASLRISEVMASNRTAYPDETGAFPDWIELTNASDHAIDLTGYGLSDRADRIAFVFPEILLGLLVVAFLDPARS